jgi:hypothetical protein
MSQSQNPREISDAPHPAVTILTYPSGMQLFFQKKMPSYGNLLILGMATLHPSWIFDF